MFKKSRSAFSFFLFALVFLAPPAHAVENIVFGSSLGATSRLLITSYLNLEYSDSLESYEAARTDLNDDGIDEIILRQAGCTDRKKSCYHLVLAQQGDKVFKLSEFTARYIMLAGTYSHGIRDILAFRNQKNDYDFDLYVWDSHKAQYKLELQKKAAKVEE